MNGINLELLRKIQKLDEDQREVLLKLFESLSQATTFSEKRNVRDQFRNNIDKKMKEKRGI